MTRAEISKELDRVACEWRVPLSAMRSQRKNNHRGGLPLLARCVFMRSMWLARVPAGHVAWALNSTSRCVEIWYSSFKKAEEQWWGVKAS